MYGGVEALAVLFGVLCLIAIPWGITLIAIEIYREWRRKKGNQR